MPRRAGTAGDHLDPERIVFNEREIHGNHEVANAYLQGVSVLLTGTGGSVRGKYAQMRLPRTVTLAFLVPKSGVSEAEERYEELEEADTPESASGPVVAVSVKMNLADLRNRWIAQGQTLEEIFDFQRGYPKGTTQRVYELAIRPSVGG